MTWGSETCGNCVFSIQGFAALFVLLIARYITMFVNICLLSNFNNFYIVIQIGADGINSMVRKMSGIHTVNWEYGQMGVVATLNLTGVSVVFMMHVEIM